MADSSYAYSFSCVLFMCILSLCMPFNQNQSPYSYDDPDLPDDTQIVRNFTFSEVLYRSCILCPRNYYISGLSYHFEHNTPDGQKTQQKTAFLTLQDTVYVEQKGLNALAVDQNAYGPCATLLHCLGHQACLFSLSIEFCRNDPNPGFRKVLLTNVTCSRQSSLDDLLNTLDHVDLNMERSSFVKKMSQVKVVKAELQSWDTEQDLIRNNHEHQPNDPKPASPAVSIETVSIKMTAVDNHEVFDRVCMNLVEAEAAGFHGSCINESPDVSTVTDDMWFTVARAHDTDCRQQLHEVYCAYKYNPSGDCIPPFAKQGKTVEDMASWSLPERGVRPDMKEYELLLQTKHKALIPARLGFMILAHQAPTVLGQLLNIIYRKNNFYVIHVEYRKDAIRQEVETFIQKLYPGASNIRILPKNRSFLSSWGSYGVMRAEMECFEELLRMGVWDYAINLSGLDLPLRDIDELAMALAPVRGTSFMRNHGRALDFEEDRPLKFAWHACGGYLFNVTERDQRPESVMTAMTFGIFYRDMAELLVHPTGYEGVQPGFLYYMQSSMIPDEAFMLTMIQGAGLFSNITRRAFHFLKAFIGEDTKNMCRHRDETDTCGRGPSFFQQTDIPTLPPQSHLHFFGRKFSKDEGDLVRQMLTNALGENIYQKEQRMVLTAPVIRSMAEKVLPMLQDDKLQAVPKLLEVTDFYVTPNMNSTDSCCADTLQDGNYIVQEYIYWIEMLVENNNIKKKARASLVSKEAPSFTCFPLGEVRAIHLTTQMDTTNPMGMHRGPPQSNKMTTPRFYDSAEPRALWVNIAIDRRSEVPSGCQAKAAEEQVKHKDETYITFPEVDLEMLGLDGKRLPPGPPPPELMDKLPSINLKLTLYGPDGASVCEKIFEAKPPLPDPKMNDISVFSQPLDCGPFREGWWTLHTQQVDVTNAHVYKQKILLLPMPQDSLPGLGFIKYLDDYVKQYITVQDAAFLDDLDPRPYYPGMEFDLDAELLKAESIMPTSFVIPSMPPHMRPHPQFNMDQRSGPPPHFRHDKGEL